jgi:hypothetical protein
LATTVSYIHGRDRVDAVEVSPVDPGFKPIPGKAQRIECDTVLLSVGLIPENELSRQLGVQINPLTQGPIVDSTMMTDKDGVFACGNVLHVHDVADYVTEESLKTGRFAGAYATGQKAQKDTIKVVTGDKVRYALPHTISRDREHTIYLRVMAPMESCHLHVGELFTKKRKVAHPAEMIKFKITPDQMESLEGDTLEINVVPETPES